MKPATSSRCNFRFSIDRGGTFTDVYAEYDDFVAENVPASSSALNDNVGATPKRVCRQRVLKLLSEDPSNYKDAPTEGIRRVLEEETGLAHPRDKKLDTSRITSIRMGTTVSGAMLRVVCDMFFWSK